MLVLLTRLTSIKGKFKWTKIKQCAFDKIKRIVDPDTILTYTDYNQTFKIHTDDRAFRLGAVIIHKSKPISFSSIKVTDVQQSYTVTEKELIIIVETLKEFRTILLGLKLIIYTDH